MFGPLRGLGLLLFAGACAASAGCWVFEDSTREDETKPEPQPTARTQAALLRGQLFAAHHDRCVEVFVKAEGFGHERRPRLTHRQSDYPRSLQLPPEADLPSPSRPGEVPAEPAASAWLMAKADLVSLLEHDKPGVYPTDGKDSRFHRPRIRDLDEFEKAALAELQKGEQVRMAEAPEGVRLVGAIRARKDCLKCHTDKKEGDLLGAFTYVFERQKP